LNGIYYINESISLGGHSKNDSIQFQKNALVEYIKDQHIQITKLNRYQINDHYSILHALLYDLKKKGIQMDCLILYAPEVINEFITTYPARWILLKSFFSEVILLRASSF
jgi:hypothetical protein